MNNNNNNNNNNTKPQRSISSVRMTHAQVNSLLGWGSPRMTHEEACSLFGLGSPLVSAKSKRTSQPTLQTKTSPSTLALGHSLSAHQGQGKAPLKDVSNMKKPSNAPATKAKLGKMIHSTDDKEKIAAAAAGGGGAGSFKPKLTKMALLNQVTSQWRTGKGVCQTPRCMEAIRSLLEEGIPRADLAEYVAAGLSEEVQAMELKRAKACVTRIYDSMTSIDKPKKKKTKRGAHMKKVKLLPGQYGY